MNTSNKAAKLFTSVVKGKNFMTPYLIGYYEIKDGAVELTEGDFMGDEIFGVTVVINGVHKYDLSKSFPTKGEAMEYIEQLNSSPVNA